MNKYKCQQVIFSGIQKEIKYRKKKVVKKRKKRMLKLEINKAKGCNNPQKRPSNRFSDKQPPETVEVGSGVDLKLIRR